MGSRIRLYHGSDVVIEHPDVTRNTGFADLGQGFYLTDDHDAARRRAVSRARKTGTGAGVVSVFEFDEDSLPWVTMGDQLATGDQLVARSRAATEVPDAADAEMACVPASPFALRFADDVAGIRAWIEYIMACRADRLEVDALGSPAVVRAWIAAEEVELVNSGLLSADEVVGY
ncbi:MAG: DUF3990 domain-containing protein, partial [Atopobiaceae bacterium]|nr:DUF3990 domain-containing protein [Atopobiaceae bacterium]